jgi:predicted nucleic acid-binding protein
MRTLWTAAQKGSIELLFSPITLVEVLRAGSEQAPPRPWEDPQEFDALFDAEFMIPVQVDRVIAERARSIRRTYKIKAPDAIHLACAIEYNVAQLITRDGKDLKSLPAQFRADGQPLAILTPIEALHGPLGGGR